MEIGTFEAKNRFSELLDRVEKGEEVTITRHGKPVAKLVAAQTRDVARAKAAAEWILANRGANKLAGVTIKELIEEGRL